MFNLRFCALALVTFLYGGPTVAHEFWIDPVEFEVEPGAPVIAALRNGEEFSGISLVWNERQFSRFDMVVGEVSKPVVSRLGDRPAMTLPAPGEGLAVILHETTPKTLRYREWEKFVRFVTHKDAAWVEAAHRAAGWPESGFQERYTRHAKALVAVGDGTGEDRAFGLETEFVALTNPYADGFDREMRVLLLYQGEPRADAQVEIFDKAPDGTVDIATTRTDATGRAMLSVQPGHTYLLDAVVLKPAESATEGALWQSLWAALTFHVPAD